MITSKIENHIVKFLNRSATSVELDELLDWINMPENKQIFIDYVQIHYAITYSINDLDVGRLKDRLMSEIQKEKSVFYMQKLQSVFKYAAVILVFLSVGYFYQQNYFTSESGYVNTIEDITLQLENGNVEIINEEDSGQVVDSDGNVLGVQNGNQLVYKNNVTKETLVYNVLNVPYGRQFEIELSDGTNVHLNSGSSLKYPVKFIKGEERKVFLQGEAYFKVTKDRAHPFVVNAGALDLRVLGTQFNVTSYSEDTQINTVLVEGSLGVYEKEQSFNMETATILKPGFRASWVKESDKVTVEEADVEMYTAWIYGKVMFRNVSFKEIAKKLERHYNVNIINNNKSLENESFTASFDVETIEEVFQTLQISYDINYSIIDNVIIIN